MKHILLVDDDSVFLSSLAEMLRLTDRNFAVFTAENGEQAVAIMDTMPIDLLITDLRMPVMDGLELTLRTAENHPEIPVIVMSACGPVSATGELGMDVPYIDKPLDIPELIGTVRSLLRGAA
ncbi:MAG TPA: response regulator [Nitrospirota bacterium]